MKMKKVYEAPRSELMLVVAQETVTAQWDAICGRMYNGSLDNPSSVDFTLPENPEGDF